MGLKLQRKNEAEFSNMETLKVSLGWTSEDQCGWWPGLGRSVQERGEEGMVLRTVVVQEAGATRRVPTGSFITRGMKKENPQTTIAHH